MPQLTKFWTLNLPPLASSFHKPYADVVKRLEEIVALLSTLEAQGRNRVGGRTDRSYEADALLNLGVDLGMALSKGEPGVFFVPPGEGGASGPGAIVAAAISEARKPDNVTKLMKGHGGGSRHLFVWIAATRAVPYFALADRVLPNQHLDLPPVITDLWIGGVFRSGEVVWHSSGGRWRDVVTDRAFSDRD